MFTPEEIKAEQQRLFKIERKSGFTVRAVSQCEPFFPFKRTTRITKI